MITTRLTKDELGKTLFKAAVSAVVSVIVAQLFLRLINAPAHHEVILPAAGSAGFSVSGWKLVAPSVVSVIAVAVVVGAVIAFAALVVAFVMIVLLPVGL